MPITIEDQRAALESVAVAALQWWESKRPLSDDLRQHLDHPTVNTATEAESALAKSIAVAVEIGAI